MAKRWIAEPETSVTNKYGNLVVCSAGVRTESGDLIAVCPGVHGNQNAAAITGLYEYAAYERDRWRRKTGELSRDDFEVKWLHRYPLIVANLHISVDECAVLANHLREKALAEARGGES